MDRGDVWTHPDHLFSGKRKVTTGHMDHDCLLHKSCGLDSGSHLAFLAIHAFGMGCYFTALGGDYSVLGWVFFPALPALFFQRPFMGMAFSTI